MNGCDGNITSAFFLLLIYASFLGITFSSADCNSLCFIWMQGGCCGLCDMGAHNSSFLGFLSSVFVLPAYAAGLNLNLHHHAVASMHENYKANKIGQEKEAKDASSIVYVESKFGWRFFLLSHPVM